MIKNYTCTILPVSKLFCVIKNCHIKNKYLVEHKVYSVKHISEKIDTLVQRRDWLFYEKNQYGFRHSFALTLHSLLFLLLYRGTANTLTLFKISFVMPQYTKTNAFKSILFIIFCVST